MEGCQRLPRSSLFLSPKLEAVLASVISVLPIIPKVFESLVLSQVYDYLQHHGILHHAQSGFRAKHSTQDVLLNTVDDWRLSLSRNEVVGAVFVDLSKAFDSISHELLLQKLDCYVTRGTPLE